MTHKIKEVTHKSYDGPEDADNDFICGLQLERIANSLEEILRLVKQDMDRMKKLNEEPEEGDMRDHFTKATIND